MKSIAILTKTVAGPRTHYIEWPQRALPAQAFTLISKWVHNSHDYSPMTSAKMATMKQFVDQIGQKCGQEIAIETAISIRNIVIKAKIIKNYSRMNSMAAKIAAEYMAGANILKLSSRYDFPPLNLLRGILLYKGLPSAGIYSIFANRKPPATLLSGWDLQQYKLAEQNDAESTFTQQRIAEIAAKNEAAVVAYFRAEGIGLVTQDQLVADQTIKFGRAVLTPDILFAEPVYINGARVHWIDYKDYIGTSIGFLFKSNSDQARKYNAEWGPGALCYHRGFVEGLVIPGAMLLDASALPILLE